MEDHREVGEGTQSTYGSPQRQRRGTCKHKVLSRWRFRLPMQFDDPPLQLVPSLQVKKLSFLEFLQNTLMLRLHKCQLENRLLISNACGSNSFDMREY